ncbi:MAG: DNA-binding protein [Bacteroidetes bacterium]|nr:MAG: DNA-binding protein [Bacteroidota bacterium]
MNKTELISAISDQAGITKEGAKAALEATIGSIQNAVQQGDKVSIPGFATWSASYRPARDGRNPSTGKTIKIADRVAIKFKAGKTFSDAVNNDKLKKQLK